MQRFTSNPYNIILKPERKALTGQEGGEILRLVLCHSSQWILLLWSYFGGGERI